VILTAVISSLVFPTAFRKVAGAAFRNETPSADAKASTGGGSRESG
jgi:hypothetical protein